jgi:hypothetical protein
MNWHGLAEAIRHMAFFTGIRESSYLYPVILSTHLSCIALFGGLILVTNLRLFGLVLTRHSIAGLIRQLRPWKWTGLILMLSMGICLAGSKMTIYYDNPFFLTKIGTLLLIWLHSMVFRKSVYCDETIPTAEGPKSTTVARLAGALSLALWITMVTMGRWIAYYDRPSPLEATLASPSPNSLLRASTAITRLPSTLTIEHVSH